MPAAQKFFDPDKMGWSEEWGVSLNLLRWVSPRTIKETFVSPTDWRYPFLG